MYFKQFYLACLAHASYLIGSDGEAVVVDPQRDVDEYLKEASAHGLQIKYVIETHLHADFVSGHQEIAARTGAQIVFGEKADVEFAHQAVRDSDEACQNPASESPNTRLGETMWWSSLNVNNEFCKIPATTA